MTEVKPQKFIWFDGELVKWKDAKIHVVSHVIHYGTGVFEGIRAYKTDKGSAIFRLKEHLKRFYYSAKVYRMNIPYNLDELVEACKLVVRENGLNNAYIRPIALKDCADMSLNAKDYPVRVAIAAWHWKTYLGEAYIKGCRCKVSSWRRIPPFSLPVAAKACGHYLNSQIARMEADVDGYDEAIMLDYRGFISEGSGENIFLVKNGELFTPPVHASILVGVTRDTLIKISKDSGYRVYERDLTLSELYFADEAFFAGTAAEVTPIVEVNGIKIGDGRPGKITKKLQKMYEDAVRGRIGKYIQWLTFVK